MKHLIGTILFVFAFALSSFAQRFTVKVIGISDGDTFTAVNRDNLQLKIRLYGIDAPERGQDFENKAKQALSDYIFGKNVEIDVQTHDGWGRYISFVCTPEGYDVSLLMLY